MPAKLLLATTNPGKLKELSALLAGIGFDLAAPADIGLDLDVAETGTTFEENARIKAIAWARAAGLITLVDDSGLEVDALGGEPGVLSARYGGPGLTDEDRTRLVLERTQGVPAERRSARFHAVVAVATPDGQVWVAHGKVEGRLADSPRGANGFGYDPIFELPDRGVTTAELPPAEKHAISHRGRAVRAVIPILEALAAGRIPSQLTHFDEQGRARMVDVGAKADTERVAVARGRVVMKPATLELIRAGRMAKGDVLAVAQVAGIMGAKQTPFLIPMCHPLLITSVTVDYRFEGHDTIEIEATTRTTGKTGVEMEAVTAVSICALTIYDMCKAVDRAIRITDIRLVHKSGGKSGTIDLE